MTEPGSLDYWRKLFRSTGFDIFEVIESAVMIAAVDHSDEFSIRRDRIAEMLFTCRLDRCIGCDRVRGRDEVNVDPPINSNISYDEAEALTEEMEEEGQVVGEVLRIRKILEDHREQSDGVLFDELRRLQLMALSVETLKVTEIGRAVNRLRKHGSGEIRDLARMLIDGWKLLVDEWVSTAPTIPDNSPDSINPSGLDEEEGLPSPPLDEAAFFSTQTNSIQLSEIFDGMDDDGNLKNEGELERKQVSGGRPELERKRVSGGRPMETKPVKKQNSPPSYFTELREQKRQVNPKLQQTPNGQSIIRSKLSNTDPGPGRPVKLASDQKCRSDLNFGARKMSASASQDNTKNSEDASVRAKLEVAKRKLQERYQEAENAKKQRTIQVMELCDLPKQGHAHHNRLPSNAKHKSNIRNWASGRR